MVSLLIPIHGIFAFVAAAWTPQRWHDEVELRRGSWPCQAPPPKVVEKAGFGSNGAMFALDDGSGCVVHGFLYKDTKTLARVEREVRVGLGGFRIRR
jgi:hypothetical protein